MSIDQQQLARELHQRADLLTGADAAELHDLATLIASEHHPRELARWIADAAEVGRNGADTGDAGSADLLAESRVDLTERIRDGIPEREYVPGCDGWLIRGKRYLVFSPSGVGKSLGVLVAAVEIVRQGGTVAIIDVENGADEYARRLELIVGDDQELVAACSERLRYYEYPALSLTWGEEEWVGTLAAADVVVFDSSRHVLSTLGLAEDANDDYARFMGRVVMPLSKAGKTTMVLDNAGHEGDHPRGASAKRDLNEVLFSLTVPGGDLDLETERRLIWRRTRGRFASAIPHALEQRIGGGTYGAPRAVEHDDDGGGAVDQFRPTGYMERVSRYIEFNPGCSQTKIVKGVGGKERYIVDALQLLDGGGYIRHEDGLRNSKDHYSVTPYREAEDESIPTHAPPTPEPPPGPTPVDPKRPTPRTAAPPMEGGGRAWVVDPPTPEPTPAPPADVVESTSAELWNYTEPHDDEKPS